MFHRDEEYLNKMFTFATDHALIHLQLETIRGMLTWENLPELPLLKSTIVKIAAKAVSTWPR